MRKNFLFIILIIASLTIEALAQKPIISIGPMIHINLPYGPQPARYSWGIEVAVWWERGDSLLYSIDIGFDKEDKKWRLYTEYQSVFAYAITGWSAGPCLQFERNIPVQFGMQASVWGNYFLGLDARIRYVTNDVFTFSPGGYYKMLFVNGVYPVFFAFPSVH